MQLKTTEYGNLGLYTDKGDFQVIDGIKSINFSSNIEGLSPLTVTIEVMLSAIDVTIPCEGLNQDIKVFTICPVCGKKKIECLCKQSNFANNIELIVRDKNDKPFGYVQSIKIEQSSSKSSCSIEKYELEGTKVKLDENKRPKLFKY